MDFLVQRYVANIANEHAGAWIDCGVVRDLKADEQEKAIERVELPPDPGPLRVVKWDGVEEFDAVPGPPTIAKRKKNAPA